MGINTGQLSGSGELIVAGSGSVMGDMGVSGSLKVASHGATGAGETAISGAGDLNVGGNVYIEGTLNLSSSISGANGAITIRSGDATKLSKIAMGTNANKVTIGVPGAADTFFSDTAQGDLVLRADDNNNKVHIGAGTSGGAGMVVTEVSNVGRVGIGTASPSHPLTVAGGISGSSTLDIVGATTLESTLDVSGAISGAVSLYAMHLITSGAVSASGPLDVKGAATLESTLNVSGAISGAVSLYAMHLITSGAVSASGPLDIKGAATLESTLNVTGAITTAAGVTGSTGISSSYMHTNNLAVNDGGANSVRINGNGVISGSSNINAAGTANIFGGLITSGAISASGDMNVVGSAFVEGDLNVTGTINGTIALSNVSSSGELNIVGQATLENFLHVSGAISGAVGITGSSITVNDTIELNANGNITKAASYSGSSDVSALNLYANNGGTKSVSVKGDGTVTIAGGAADTTCLSASGDVNIVGKAYLENTLNVSGAISGAVSLYAMNLITSGAVSASGPLDIVGTATVEVSASYAHTNNLAVNDGGTKSIRLNGDGTVVIAGGAEGTTCLSASGDLNVVGNSFFENNLHVTGALHLQPSNSVAVPGIRLINSDVDQEAIKIEASNTTADVLSINADDCLTTGVALKIDHNDAATSAVSPKTVHIDFDKDGVTGDGVTSAYTLMDLDMDDGATNHANATVQMVGLDLDITSANAQGSCNNYGIIVDVTGGDINMAAQFTGDTPSQAAVSITNTGNNANRYGLLIKAGTNSISGTPGSNIYAILQSGNGSSTNGIIANSGASDGNVAFAASSDERLKRDIAPTKVVGLDVLAKIILSEFRWKKDGADGPLTKLGFIAQNCEKAYPEMVSQTAADLWTQHGELDHDVKTVSPAELIPVLVKAIQELKAKVEELEEKLSE